jgi:hypothetical protein
MRYRTVLPGQPRLEADQDPRTTTLKISAANWPFPIGGSLANQIST